MNIGFLTEGTSQALLTWWLNINICRKKQFLIILDKPTSKSLSVLFSHWAMSNCLWLHGLQHARLFCPSPTPWACSNSCPLSWWCHPTVSSSVVPFSSCLQSFPASGSFLMSQLFASPSQSIGALASASVLPMNIQDWFPLWLTGLISLQSRDSQEPFPTPVTLPL